jgi:hypothetical protein
VLLTILAGFAAFPSGFFSTHLLIFSRHISPP